MYFQELQSRLVGIARARIRAGELTERGLARLASISQPQMHNVLKSIRGLSTGSADRLMRALDLRLPDLLWRISTESDAAVRAISMLQHRIGPGSDADFAAIRGHIPLPESLLAGVIDPLAARLAPDLVLPGALAAHDLVLLDQNPLIRAAPGYNGIWVVSEGSGLRVRYLRWDAARLGIADEVTLEDPQRWHSIPLQGRNILDIVRARIVWIGREMEKEPAGPPDPAC